jgi:hypothetical protein
MKRLGVSLPETCGTLELLWHFTAAYTPAGDVGRYTDVAIADGIGWKGDPGKLVVDLAGAGFLEPCADARYLVHDWPEHCDDAVHMKLARELRTFADGTEPRQNRLSRKERAALEEKRTGRAHTVRTESAPPRPAPPRHEVETDPPQTPPAGAVGARLPTKAQAAVIADRIAARYRELLGRAPAGRLVRHWRTELRQGVSEGAIAALLEAEAAEKRLQAEADASEQARWDEAHAWIDRHGGRRVVALAALDWCERNRGPDESVDQALVRWATEGGFPREVVGQLVKELYELRKQGRGERKPARVA